MKYNLHTHSFYCGHGSGLIHEYYEEAKNKEFDVLGFSEHCPFPDNKTFKNTRMSFDSMPRYTEDVRECQREGGIKVLLGYECDYLPEWKGYFEDLCGDVDYLISGTHYVYRDDGRKTSPFRDDFSSSDLVKYTKIYIDAMRTGLFLFMAHPDVFLLNYPWNENARSASLDIIEAAMELDMPLEINSNGIEKARESGSASWGYPNDNFWYLAKEKGVKAVISSDAHKVENLYKNYERVWEFSRSLDIDILYPVIKDGKIELRTEAEM